MVTPDWWIIPFNINNRLTRLPVQPSIDDDLDRLTHVIITNDDIWDPTVLDHLIDLEHDIIHPGIDSNINDEDFTSFDDCTSVTGPYLHHDDYGPNYFCDVYHNDCVTHSGLDVNTGDNSCHFPPQCMIKDQDYEALHLYLLWLPMDHIKYTLTTTTQWFHNMYCIPFHKYFKSRFPATNISCHDDPVTTDTMDGTDPTIKMYLL